MSRKFFDMDYDEVVLLLGLLNSALRYDLDAGDPTLRDLLGEARERLFPGWHNAGDIQCTTCLDMGVVCTQCGYFPHQRGCENIKGIPTMGVCQADQCEAAHTGDERIQKLKLRDLEAQLAQNRAENDRLRLQLEQAHAKLREQGVYSKGTGLKGDPQ